MMIFIPKPISTTCIEYSFGTCIDKKINDMVLKVYRFLPRYIDLKKAGIIDIVPSYTALAIHFNTSCELLKEPHAYDDFIERALEETYNDKAIEHTVYVDYRGEDIDELCQKLKLSKRELIKLHTAAYSIAMIGFREHFPYLLGLDERLNIPRRDAPKVGSPVPLMYKLPCNVLVALSISPSYSSRVLYL